MVAATWDWDSAYMASPLRLEAALAVLSTPRGQLRAAQAPAHRYRCRLPADAPAVPLAVSAIHLVFLAAVVVLGHHPVLFLGMFMLFLGFTSAYQRYQSR
jgi:hypothetical protein